MGLITETNRQYYQGYQKFIGGGGNKAFTTTFNTDLVWNGNATHPSTNFRLYKQPYMGSMVAVASGFTVSGNTITFDVAPGTNDVIAVQLLRNDGGEFSTKLAIGNITEDNYGSYAYTKLSDIINNFIVGYVGEGKLIPSVKKSDVIFHAKRGLQEFSYDVLKSIKSQELTIPPSLSLIIPQDYVNYVKLSWIDELGVKRIIQPTTLTSNPLTMPQQDSTTGVPEQYTQSPNSNIERTSSTAETAWSAADMRKITGNYYNNNNDETCIDARSNILGQRYGLNPETTQTNGWFTINEREGKFSFSSNLNGNVIILEYISDGLATDLETKVPKMAEEAMYAHLSYSILAGRASQPEYVVQRLKRDRSAKLRNAKIRLSNVKLGEIIQVMRNKSKQIK